MKICRYTLAADPQARPRLGLMEAGGVRDVTAVTDELPALRWPLPLGDQVIGALPSLQPRMQALASNAPLTPRDQVRLLSPVANPGKFVCGVGNWPQHKVAFGALGFLVKVTSAMAGEGEGVQLRWPDRTTVFEAELGIVIGRECTNVSEAEALDYVAGYTCALDMTLERNTEDFAFCKSFDSYGVLGPCLVTADEIPNPSELEYRFWLNGELKQAYSFGDLKGSPARLIALAASIMTLHPGDVIYSGTPETGPVAAGDVMSIEIPRIGRMDVAVSVSAHARELAPEAVAP